MSDTSALTVERSDAVMILHLDDGKANALSFEMLDRMMAALDEAERDDDIRAVVVNGRPGKFSGGFDLGVMMSSDFSEIVKLVARGGELVHRLYGISVPVVAACTGHALAAGALILLGCDVRVGADIDAKIGLPEVAIKMVLPDWAFTITEARLSKRHMQRAVVNARITGPADAVDIGYLDEVVPLDQVLDRAVAIATELAATLDPSAYERTVHNFRGDTLDTMANQVAADRVAAT